MCFFHIVFTPFQVLKDPLSCLHILVKITLGKTVCFTNHVESESAYLHTNFPLYKEQQFLLWLSFHAVIFKKQLIM
jgi:hypothetical protein